LTKRINGGVNGLAHRRELLNKANGLLGMLSLSSDTRA
jgi:predicted chitinase